MIHNLDIRTMGEGLSDTIDSSKVSHHVLFPSYINNLTNSQSL